MAYTHNFSNACISSRDAYAPENVVQDASPRIKERNRPVKYNLATAGKGGAIREDRLSFVSRGEFAVIYFLLCDMSLVRINQVSLHFFALIEIRGKTRRLLPSCDSDATPNTFSIIIIIFYRIIIILYYAIITTSLIINCGDCDRACSC